MTSEFTPPWSNAHMTPAQVRKYVRDMKKAQAIAEEKLKIAKESWEFEKEKKELSQIENEIEDLNSLI